jgi:hypothetical protein
MFPLDAKLMLQALGLVFVALGGAARLGLWKQWYWKSRGTVYGYIPLGGLFLVYSLDSLAVERLGSRYILFQGLIGLLIALGLWWSIRPPAFVKPAWVRWLERHPKQVLQAMAQAAEEDKGWEQQVVSQEAVDHWAKALQKRPPRSKRPS